MTTSKTTRTRTTTKRTHRLLPCRLASRRRAAVVPLAVTGVASLAGTVAGRQVALQDRPAPAPAEITPEARVVADVALEVVQDLLNRMDLPSEVRVDLAVIEDSLPTIELSIHGEFGGILIGRRGETLGAIQFIVGLLTSRKAERRVRVVLDAEGYRERRSRLLRDIALRSAERAQRYRQPVFLDPMSPAERRIVHMTLADHQGVSTHSVGEGDSRRVVVSPRQAQRFGGYGPR